MLMSLGPYVLTKIEQGTKSPSHQYECFCQILCPSNVVTVIAADGLYKRDVFRETFPEYLFETSANCCKGFPDPFAVATIDGEQTRTTTVIKKTLNPYWNEAFDMYGGC